MNNTIYFEEYKQNIKLIGDSEKTAYTLKLFFANVITLMKVYLSKALISTVQGDRNLIIKVTESKLFNTRKIDLKTAFTNDIEQYILGQINHTIFHNLNDVFILYRDVFGIEFRQGIILFIEMVLILTAILLKYQKLIWRMSLRP